LLRLILVESPRPQAGFPSPAADYVETTLDLNEYLIDNPVSTFYLRVQGDSMIDAHVYEGDILVVDRSRIATRGRIVVASVQGGNHLFVKKLGQVRGATALFSCNQARVADYPPILLESDDAAEIWGVVVATVRKF
jgi:DNA polymerase V